MDRRRSSLSRRAFIGMGGAVIAGGALPLQASQEAEMTKKKAATPKIAGHRTLGRTGFRVSDISMGTTRVRDSAVIKYAFECGINYIDTGESYNGGNSERMIGENLGSFDRKNIFITTKIHIGDKDTKDTVLDRFRKCQERLKTDYIDAFYMHGVSDLEVLAHEGFHEAAGQLKSEGRLKHIGVSCHGARWGRRSASMEDVLCAAAEDGRFDLMLLIYNFMNRDAGEKVLKACRERNIGTTAMKTTPGVLKVDTYDPENPTEDQKRTIERMKQRGMSDEEIAERIDRSIRSQEENRIKTVPFAEKHGIRSEEELKRKSIAWVLQNPDMHTVCVSFTEFSQLEGIVPVSGTKLSGADIKFLEDFSAAYGPGYCRHGCSGCAGACPNGTPVSTIMRYAYYFQCQQREKYAIAKYRALEGRDASSCFSCQAPCGQSCPYGVDPREQLIRAHSLLTLV